jgi:regulatory protein
LRTKGYSAILAALTLEKLRALGYADDSDFARNWARSRAEGRGFGPTRIEQELRAKGIDEPLIRSAISEIFTRGDESERAGRALKKKFGGEKLDDAKTLRRAAAFLQRCGYSETVIHSLLRQHED